MCTCTQEATPSNVLKVHLGWYLLGALVSMGAAAVSSRLQELVQLWSSSLTSNTKLDAKSPAVQWEMWMQHRDGALATMTLLLTSCRDLVTDDAQRTIAGNFAVVVEQMGGVPSFTSKATTRLQPLRCRLRARLYKALSSVPMALYEDSFAKLLPLLVADFTLTELPGVTSRTSLLGAQCHPSDAILLGSQRESDYDMLEHQLVTHGGEGLGRFSCDVFRIVDPNVTLQVY